MLRTFLEHAIRPVASLDGRWGFVTEKDRSGRSKLPREYPGTIQVPGVWESLPGLENYRGRAWYRTWVQGSAERALRLVFGGVSHTAKVYIDGQAAGGHYDAYTPWDVVIPPGDSDRREVVVEVDNTFGEHSALHKENDYYTYGGITRPVEAQLVPEVFIERLFATPARKGKIWELELRVRLRNWSKNRLRRSVIVSLGDSSVEFKPVVIEPDAIKEITGVMSGLDVEPWSNAAPVLHEIEAALLDDGQIVDDLIDRIGFREIKVSGKKLLLNGRPIRLRGYNRHEDHPHFGCALPVEAMAHDLEILRDLGCNFVRTSHYPNDRRFLDLCDELGIYIWEESHARQVDFKHPRFRRQMADVTAEMVDWHRNHPCIILWGCLNECDAKTPAGRSEYERVLKLLKKLDPSRPVTFASNHRELDICLGLVDIVSWNLYDAWYRGGVDGVEPELKRLLKWLHSPKSRGGSGKPVIMSEFGGGAIYGYRNPNHAKWTEEYLSEVLDESLRVYLNHPDVIGAAIWQFCDIRVTPNYWKGRPRTMNNKGTVDEYRRRKFCYEAVKRRMVEARERGA